MPKFTCRCGNLIDLSPGWSSAEFALLPELNIEEIASALRASTEFSDEDFYAAIDGAKRKLYFCNICRRMHIEREDKKNEFLTYKLE